MASVQSQGSETWSLLALQSRMKCDPGGYEEDLLQRLRHFEACLSIHNLQPAASSASGTTEAKELADMALFLAHVMPSYPQHLSHYPQQLLQLLSSKASTLQPALRRHLAQALILLRNRQMIELIDILPLLMELQTLGDSVLRKLAFLHIVHDIRRMNLKHRNEAKNRALQNVLFSLLQEDSDMQARRALIVLCDLYRRKLWVDERASNAICDACFHNSSKILQAALSFLLGFERIDEEEDDAESSGDEVEDQNPSISLSREAVYKAYHKGTSSSRKKKQAKLDRLVRSLKKQQRAQTKSTDWSSSSPLQHLRDPQNFAEKLFSRLQRCNERFEVRLMMMKVISRAIGLHRLVVLNFYPFLQKYIQPHQREVTHLLAIAVQACHDLVPPDAVESLLRQLVNQFVHDRARPEVMAVGMNVVREMCIRMPLIMTQELLQDLAMYKKSREKAVSSAARSIISVFRQIQPSLLEKKDRGRGANLLAQPKAFGESKVPDNVLGIELLAESAGGSDIENDSDSEDGSASGSDNEDLQLTSEVERILQDKVEDLGVLETCSLEEMDDSGASGSDEEDAENESEVEESDSDIENEDKWSDSDTPKIGHLETVVEPSETSRKRKFESIDDSQLSLRELKRRASLGNVEGQVDGDGILSNEDFARIRKLQAKCSAKAALAEHGLSKARAKSCEPSFRIPTSENLNERPVNPSSLESHIRKRREKEERVASAKAGRDDQPSYMARTAIKQNKTGGLSNRQKEKKKNLPLAARRFKAAKSRGEKRSKKSSKQFGGKKAWKH